MQFFISWYFPDKLFGISLGPFAGTHKSLRTCGVGYSNILFGIKVLEAYIGSEYQKVFGMFTMKKIYVPWVMMTIIQLALPEASLTGHLCGIVSALMLRNTGIGFFLLPRYSWIKSFEDNAPCIKRMGQYY